MSKVFTCNCSLRKNLSHCIAGPRHLTPLCAPCWLQGAPSLDRPPARTLCHRRHHPAALNSKLPLVPRLQPSQSPALRGAARLAAAPGALPTAQGLWWGLKMQRRRGGRLLPSCSPSALCCCSAVRTPQIWRSCWQVGKQLKCGNQWILQLGVWWGQFMRMGLAAAGGPSS